MIKTKKTIMWLLVLLALVSSSLGYDEYKSIGYSSGQFEADTTENSNWIGGLVAGQYAESLANCNDAPLTADLDLDGDKEIIAGCGNTVHIYSGRTLEYVTQLDVGNQYLSNLEVVQFDADSENEIVVVSYTSGGNNTLHVIGFNGTNLTQQSQAQLAFSNPTGSEVMDDIMVGCDDVENVCFVAELLHDRTKVIGELCNASACNDATLLTSSALCLPHIRDVQVIDVDGDDENEFVFGFVKVKDYFYYMVKANVLNHATLNWNSNMNNANFGVVWSGSYTCADFNSYFSPLLAGDFNPSETGFEYVFALQVESIDSGNEPKIKMYIMDEGFGFLDDYPEGGVGFNKDDGIHGSKVSNVAVANIYSNTPRNDFCVMTYNPESDNSAYLLCGSDDQSGLVELAKDDFMAFAVQYKNPGFTNVPPYNLTLSRNHANSLIHGMRDPDYFGQDIFVTPYGVYAPIDFGTDVDLFDWDFSIIGFTPLGLAFIFDDDKQAVPVVDWKETAGLKGLATVPVDYEGLGAPDILALTNTNLYYLDDQFTNFGCGLYGDETRLCMETILFNPCYTETWKLNTTFTVTVTGSDVNSNDLNYRFTSYVGTGNEQDSNWTGNVTSGSSYTFPVHQANQTVTGGVLRVQARDASKPELVETKNFYFNVQAVGIEYGDVLCTESYDITPTPEPTPVPQPECNDGLDNDGDGFVDYPNDDGCTSETDDSEEKDIITTGLESVGEQFGLSIQIIYLLFMFGFLWGIWATGDKTDATPETRLGVMLLFVLIAIILGLHLGTMGFGTLLVFLIISVVALGVMFRKSIISTSGGA